MKKKNKLLNNFRSNRKLGAEKYEEYIQKNNIPEGSALRKKMSENLIKVAFGSSFPPNDLDEYHIVIQMSIVGWNLALLDEEPCKKKLQEFIDELNKKYDPANVLILVNLIKRAIRRKLRYFPDDVRHIKDYSVTSTETQYHLFVTSIIPKYH